jgi:hypothetical protein
MEYPDIEFCKKYCQEAYKTLDYINKQGIGKELDILKIHKKKINALRKDKCDKCPVTLYIDFMNKI